jgi:hypothetical protein
MQRLNHTKKCPSCRGKGSVCIGTPKIFCGKLCSISIEIYGSGGREPVVKYTVEPERSHYPRTISLRSNPPADDICGSKLDAEVAAQRVIYERLHKMFKHNRFKKRVAKKKKAEITSKKRRKR